MSKQTRILWSGLTILGMSCGDDVTVTPPPEPPPAGVRSVSVAPDGFDVSVGGTLQMTVAVTLDQGATGTATVTWSTSDNSKATVSPTGLVTGIAAGAVGIRATATLGSSSAQGVASVRVIPASTCVITGVTVAPPTASLTVGETITLAPTVSGSNCVVGDLGVTFTSNNTAVATVSQTGVVTAIGSGTTTITVKSAKDQTRQTAMSVAVTVPAASTVSIQSVTQGGLGTPINLANVGGQIEVSLNVDRGEKTLDRVDVVIGGQVVASQTFAQASPAVSSPEGSMLATVVLSVNTRQVARTGDLFVPVVFNGQSSIAANLYVAGTATPIASNAVPVLMNNSDGAIAPPEVADEATAAPEPFVDVDGNDWFKGNLSVTINYIAFSKQHPVAAPSAFNIGPACGVATPTWSGTPTTGLTVTNSWGCPGFEGPLSITGPGTTNWGTLVGIDGSALRGPDIGMPNPPNPPIVAPGYSTVGAQFTLPGNLARWNLITPTANALPGPYFVDNKAPLPTIGTVAFSDLFDQPWINGEYDFTVDLDATDGGTGVALVVAHDYLDGVFDPVTAGCTATVKASGAAYDETEASDGTPDGERICGYAEDQLGNAAGTGPSNYFGVDKTRPSARIAGSTGAGPALPPGTVPAVSGAPNSTIFPIAAPFATTNVWGVEGLDDRSGFDQNNAVPGLPARESITIFSPTHSPAVTFRADTTFTCGFTGQLQTLLSDFWVRVSHVPFAALLDCGLGGPMYVNVSLQVVDRAGNASTAITRNYAIDQYAAPFLGSIGPAGVFYTPGQPANFLLFGSDDLEIIEANLILNYGGFATAGDATLLSITKSLSPIAGAVRWDSTLSNVLNGAPAIDPFLIGRVDRTCTGPGTPYPSCAVADGAALSAEYNNVGGGTDDAKNPTSVGAVAFDVAGQSLAQVASALLTAQTKDVAEQWSTNVSPAALVAWRIVTPTGGQVQAIWVTTSSTVPPYLDSVQLARLDVTGTSLVTCGAFPPPARSDNGQQRIYTYTLSKPGGPCGGPGMGNWYVLGMKAGAALVTQGQP